MTEPPDSSASPAALAALRSIASRTLSHSALFAAAGFTLVQHFLRPAGKPASEQPWLAMVLRKPA